MPTQPWELAKVMEMASGYFARFGDIHIFPTEMYKRCKFLRFLGHYSLGSRVQNEADFAGNRTTPDVYAKGCLD